MSTAALPEHLKIEEPSLSGSAFRCRITVAEPWMSATLEQALSEHRKADPRVPGFRVGQSSESVLRALLLPQAKKSAITWVLQDIAKHIATAFDLLVIAQLSADLEEWKLGADLRGSLSAQVFSPVVIDVDRVCDRLGILAQGEDSPEAVLTALREECEDCFDDSLIKMIVPENLAGDPHVAQRIKESLLLDSLSRQLELEITDNELNAQLARIASEQGLSMIEIEDELARQGGIDVFRRELTRGKALGALVEHARGKCAASSE